MPTIFCVARPARTSIRVTIAKIKKIGSAKTKAKAKAKAEAKPQRPVAPNANAAPTAVLSRLVAITCVSMHRDSSSHYGCVLFN